ncbi:hypothetical protein ABRQ22_16780 [Cellulosimicrobium sp. ES-005]|uniref:Uncharacterized protein n=1 Tax=Cellulosimicrobium sp. ES-005 TaxID=3163031 RepID=A0AAU8FX41_9MICO
MAIEVDVSTSLTDVVAAIGTVGALLIAALAYGAEVRRRRRESKWGQAERVSAWIGDATVSTSSTDAGLFLRNDSGAMVYGVRVHLHDGALGTIDGAIAPETTQEYYLEYDRPVLRVIPVDIEFQDAAGRSWKRHRDGRLVLVKSVQGE